MQASDSPIDDEIEVVGEVCGPGNFQRQAEPAYGMARLGPPATPPHLPLPSSCDTEASSLMSMPGQSTSSESSPVPKKVSEEMSRDFTDSHKVLSAPRKVPRT